MRSPSAYGSYRFDSGQVEMLRSELEALGLMESLKDPETTDLMVNENGSVFLVTHSGTVKLEPQVDPLALESAIATIAALHGRTVGPAAPILEATLPFYGIRVLALLPHVVASPTLTLRKPPVRLMPLSELVRRDTLSQSEASRLANAVRERETVVVAGGVGSGKTTLASALLAEVLEACPYERIVTIEEGARELQISGENVNRFLTDEEAGISTRRLIRHALRSNPDRIILGEARGAEALDFLKAANTGHPGGILTVHANSAADAVTRLDSLAQEAGVGSQRDRILEAVDWVVYMDRRLPRRVVVEIARLRSS